MKTGQKCLFSIKTVGRVNYRYRLDHQWVSEMMLNVQSKSLFNINFIEAQGIIFVLLDLRVIKKIYIKVYMLKKNKKLFYFTYYV
jgi:hypothetical protein